MTLLPEAETERDALPVADKKALQTAIEKLKAHGDTLGFPHSSAVRGVEGTLRELRPRAGRSRWRAFYRRVGDRIVVASVGPEAGVDPRGFRRAVLAALGRLAAEEAKDDG